MGHNCFLAGQVGIADHDHRRQGSHRLQKAVSTKTYLTEKYVFGYPALPGMQYHRASAIFKNLPDLARRVSQAEKEIAALKREVTSLHRVRPDDIPHHGHRPRHQLHGVRGAGGLRTGGPIGRAGRHRPAQDERSLTKSCATFSSGSVPSWTNTAPARWLSNRPSSARTCSRCSSWAGRKAWRWLRR